MSGRRRAGLCQGHLAFIHPSALHIARLKTIWSFVAAEIALTVTALKDWLFGQK